MGIKTFWHRLSYTGLEQADESSNREEVFLNKMAFASVVVMIFIAPFEVLINGWLMVPYEICMGLIASFSLVLIILI